ncbi:MAG: hypothetical protein ACQESR_14135 [Planctomycetota bacterium]
MQLNDVRKSREQWKERAQYSAKELEEMKAEVERLRKQVDQAVPLVTHRRCYNRL